VRILVAGATGVIGQPLVDRLLSAGHAVHALTRSLESARALEARGIAPLVGDVFDGETVAAAVRTLAPDAIVHQLTALPPRIRPRRVDRDMAATNRLRTGGTDVLVGAAIAGGAHLVAQSIAFLYAPAETPRAESDPLVDADVAGTMVGAVEHLESAVVDAGGAALRYGLFYGPGTVYAAGGSMREDVMRRRVPIVGSGNARFAFIHVEDAAEATRLAIEARARGIYNVVEEPAPPLREWLPRYAESLGAPPPRRIPRWLARLGAGRYGVYLLDELPPASGAAIRADLGFTPGRRWSDAPILDAA
jgi:nucleoside-diphosphate-sugar epimerase